MRPPRVEFMQAPRGSWSRGAAATVERTEGGIFWWAVAITLLLGLATFSWFFSIMVFTHPEKPMNYAILERFNKLERLKGFTEKDVPGGKAFDQAELYQTFHSFSSDNLAQKNSDLRRAYLTNYKDDRPVYVKGRFRIVHARPLGATDVFTKGIVARAIAINEHDKEYRNVVIEYVIPTRSASSAQFGTGDIIEIDTSSQRNKRRLHATLLNVQHQPDESLVFTVVPLVYGEHAVDAGKGTSIIAEPPARLNLKATWPITGKDAAVSGSNTVATVAGS